jgi:5-oxoprolinase (ATP-hydrolysing) subunit A
MMHIDLNCDLGEGSGHDAELMPLISSANIACGAHAGDVSTMRSSVALAARHGVAVGAHPGYADQENFGRREIPLPETALRELVVGQITRLREMGPVRHVKPHGALYNVAARDRVVADVIADAVGEVDPSLMLFALAGSELATAGRRRGLMVAEEVFADRSYQSNGCLTPRTNADALINDEVHVIAQVLQMVRSGTVRATDGTQVKIKADTVCLHGDGPNAVKLAVALRRELVLAGITVRAFESA